GRAGSGQGRIPRLREIRTALARLERARQHPGRDHPAEPDPPSQSGLAAPPWHRGAALVQPTGVVLLPRHSATRQRAVDRRQPGSPSCPGIGGGTAILDTRPAGRWRTRHGGFAPRPPVRVAQQTSAVAFGSAATLRYLARTPLALKEHA